ncbi:hypothetical protein DSO57_1008694 [Entomophthora muscae]|uniref:Uncharacterized protein n=1 Tax=Entomophthora muscae TaxID=34485 RepID=A0ACC2U5I9_9FUNG|nr:hypothetical protein DSO57_1008694 [Entomophthora muscae]
MVNAVIHASGDDSSLNQSYPNTIGSKPFYLRVFGLTAQSILGSSRSVSDDGPCSRIIVIIYEKIFEVVVEVD